MLLDTRPSAEVTVQEELDQLLSQPMTPEFVERLRRLMEEDIPFNRFLGMRADASVRGKGRIELPARPEFTGDPGRPALHGGLISTLADTVGGLAAFTVTESISRCSTIDLRVDYLRPGQVDTPLVGEAEILRFGNRVAVANIVIFQDGARTRPVAVGKGVYSVKWNREERSHPR